VVLSAALAARSPALRATALLRLYPSENIGLRSQTGLIFQLLKPIS
jgi:hypothetical protein